MTLDALPHMGQEDGLHFCTGCNGSGVAMMTYLGQQVARRILQDGQSDSAYDSIEFSKIPVPFYSGNLWFLPIIGNYYRYLDREDRRLSGEYPIKGRASGSSDDRSVQSQCHRETRCRVSPLLPSLRA